MSRAKRTAYAKDYREPVTILKVERQPRCDDAGTYTVQRSNGAITTNYPGYLLKFKT